MFSMSLLGELVWGVFRYSSLEMRLGENEHREASQAVTAQGLLDWE